MNSNKATLIGLTAVVLWSAIVGLIRGVSLADQLSARPFRRPADRERYLTGLRKAGLPE